VRGSKLTAWHVPPVMANGTNNPVPENSKVPQAQKQLMDATRATLAAISADVDAGLRETVGIGATLDMSERANVILDLPPEADAELMARAVDMENIEAWCDEHKRVHVAINPWYSTKDVDQTVLAVIKVVHVKLGMHASDAAQSGQKNFFQKLLGSVAEVLLVQKRLAQDKDSKTD
jgi:hypothetical protein